MKADIFRAAALALCFAVPASAHDALSGWTYPLSCCSDHDCYEIGPADFETTAAGYRIIASGELLEWTDRRIQPSGDGRWHRCSYGGAKTALTICFFVPGGA